VILAVVVGGYMYTSTSLGTSDAGDRVVLSTSSSEKEPADPPRNFTAKQLRQFDGSGGDDKPVYLSLSGIVFDVSDGRGFYGPGGPYETFAGRECGVALSKMSFDEEHLDNVDGIDQLNFGEKAELEGWIDKFTNYRCYPIMGRLIPDAKMPDPNRILTRENIARMDGSQEAPPDGYVAAPIYIGAGDKVFDMSFGGVTFYGAGGPYQKFAGKDASRALAKMSLHDADLETNDVSDVTEKQLNTLNDWIKTFEEKKSYPVVGRMEK
jgi:membrane-associated progesterone receptor component